MLHDPRHDKTPSLAGFALFVASKPRNEKYPWHSRCECAVGQYMESLGCSTQWVAHGVLDVLNKIALSDQKYEHLLEKEWTFGKLADRILAYQMAQTDAA
jgi:hypothetical protein